MTTRNKAVRITPRLGQEPLREVIDWPADAKLEQYQQEVGGYIEIAMRVDLSDRHGLVVVCNEEGHLINLPLAAVRPWDGFPLAGTLLVLGEAYGGPEGPDFQPLTEEEAALVTLAPPGIADPMLPALLLDGVTARGARTSQ